LAKNRHHGEVLVVGLGRFGGSLAEALVELGHEVLGVDADPKLVQAFAEQLTHVVEADATDIDALRQIGAGDFERAVVGIGTDIEASILVTSHLADLGVGHIWSKAITMAHGRILRRVGAHEVVFPEHDMGRRVAHLVTGRMLEFVQLDDGFALVETFAPKDLVGRSLADAQVRKRYGITIVCIKPEGGLFTYATADTVPGPRDVLVIAGEPRAVEAFAEAT
jgi:trk system potassium uptake protein TrkA